MSVLVALQGGAANDSTATWVQAPATWAATAAETFPSTATFTQTAATWAAVASEAFTATGSFTQAAAAWSAIVSETFASTATWSQAAATWQATADTPAEATFSAEWLQAAASWGASADTPFTASGHRTGPAFVIRREPTLPKPTVLEPIALVAAFSQPAASWAAVLTVNDDDLAVALAA